MYLHQRHDWPKFRWDHAGLADLQAEVRHRQGRLLGRMEGLGFRFLGEATLATLTQDVMKTSEIEGEKLDLQQVRSSLARRLGVEIAGVVRAGRDVEGIVEVMLDATRNHAALLSKKRLFDWHGALFPTGRSGMHPIVVGDWRQDTNGPMQVVSGPLGHKKIHYEAPAADRLPDEMTEFIRWFNAPPATDLILKSALAHFWFVTIHPFEDGNGRIARALGDLLLARSEKSDQRFYSLSSQILKERDDYYAILEKSKKSSLDLTPWMEWYLHCLQRAIITSEKTLEVVLTKARFWEIHAGQSFNDRQRKVINRLLDDFEGKLTSSKWAKLTKCSQDTALRDIQDLLEHRILLKEEAGGRSTNYQLLLPK